MTKIKLILSGILAIVLATGCSITKTDNSYEAAQFLAMAAVSQVTYDSLKKDYDKNIVILEKVLVILDKLDASVDMTPAEISSAIINGLVDNTNGDYQLIVDGIVEAVFTKYEIGWNDTIDKDLLHKIIQDVKSAIQTGIDTYKDKYMADETIED